MIRGQPALALLGLLAGCSALNPAVSQLEAMKANAQAGKLDANAGQTITCGAGQDACGPLHLLKGDACYALAKSGAPDRRARAQCAADELGQGLDQTEAETGPLGPRRDYAAKQLDALRTLIDTRGAGDPAGTAPLASAAAAFRARYPTDPAGPFYAATAALAEAQDRFAATGNKPALCTALGPVETDQAAGAAAPGALAPNFRALVGDIAGMRTAGACS